MQAQVKHHGLVTYRIEPERVHVESQELATIQAELKHCRNLQRGKLLHSRAIGTGCLHNRYVVHALISMYSKCGSMPDARDVFESMIRPDIVSWNNLILGYVDNGQSSVALDLFNGMDCERNTVTFVAALKACTSLGCLEKGMTVHKQARDRAFDKNVFVASTLVDMYGKCGEMRKARGVFDAMTHRSIVSWNVLMLGYVENGESAIALDVFYNIDCAPNRVTFIAALKACAASNEFDKSFLVKGMAIHARARDCGFEKDVFVASTLVDMYSRCRQMSNARDVFEGMVHRDVVSWNALILGYVENGESSVALELFDSMTCEPNCVTYFAALKACASLATNKEACLQTGLDIHRQARERGFDKDVFVANTLVEMYRKFGRMPQAREIFDGMNIRSVVSWNVLMVGYLENGESLMALDVFNNMDCVPNRVTFVTALKVCGALATDKKLDKRTCRERGAAIHSQAREQGLHKDVFVENSLINMYSKCGDMIEARNLFDEMTYRDVVSWNALVLGYMENGESLIALDIFVTMCSPDRVTIFVLLRACAKLGAIEIGRVIHVRVCGLGLEEDEMVASCLVDFYGKCGNMAVAEEVFNRMHSRNVVSWNALIGGYSLLGDTYGVFSLVKTVQEAGVQMDGVTVLLILSACNQEGKVEEARTCFKSMAERGINPTLKHYTCMVDILGRANRLQEALSLVQDVPFAVNRPVWIALLESCRKWGNVEVGEVAFQALVAVAQKNKENVAAAYVLMRNIYEGLGNRS